MLQDQIRSPGGNFLPAIFVLKIGVEHKLRTAKPTKLVTKTGQLISQDYDWSKGVAAINLPTMIAFGDADSIHPDHAVEFFKLLGGGQKDAGWDGSGMPNARLAILPGTTHYNIFSSPLLASIVISFLDAPLPNVM